MAAARTPMQEGATAGIEVFDSPVRTAAISFDDVAIDTSELDLALA